MKNGLALLILAGGLALSGCAYSRLPTIDPSGQRIFVEPVEQPPVRGEEKSCLCSSVTGVTITPNPVVAPVGSEVVLLAAVAADDNYLRTNERVEWSIAPGSVGEFVAVGRNGVSDYFFGEFWRGKIDNTFAVGTTSRSRICLTRGTPITTDDVWVQAGQAWVSLTSPVEGTSSVTAYVPAGDNWEGHKQTAIVQWLDAQWQFPAPAINPAGTKHVFTTTVSRHSDHSPCVGWRVRYEIVDGPAAGFAPIGGRMIEVTTNQAGQACAEIFQEKSTPGTNRINIQIVRPANIGCPGSKELVVASGGTMKTWTSPQICIKKSGPAAVALGATVNYSITVSNPGDLQADDVVAVDQVPNTMGYVGSNPPAEVSGSTLRWRIGRMAGRESRTYQVTLRADRKGNVNTCAEVTAAGGLKASDCLSTAVAGVAIDLSMNSPEPTTLNGNVVFEITVTNRGQTTANDLVITDTFETGLTHASMPSPIERVLPSLTPGQSQRIRVTFRATKTGKLCHTVTVADGGTVVATAKGCVTVSQSPAATAPPRTGTTTPPATAPSTGQAGISIKKSGPASKNVKEVAEFVILITNTGTQKLTGLKVVDRFDPALEPVMATAGWAYEGNDLVWKLPELAVAKTLRLEVQCRCLSAVRRACNRATVTCTEGARDESEACLEIRPASTLPTGPATAGPSTGSTTGPSTGTTTGPSTGATTGPALSAAESNLTMTVTNLRNPVVAGKEVSYEIQVTNKAATVDRQLNLTVTLPSELSVVTLGTNGPTNPRQIGQVVQFDAVPEIYPGQTLTFRVRTRTEKPGLVKVRAELTSQSTSQPIRAEESTEIVPRS